MGVRGDPSSQCLISCTREPPQNSAPWFGAPNEGLLASQACLSVFWPPGLCCCPWGQAILGSSQNKTENNPEFLAVKQYHNYVLFNLRNQAAEADPLGSAGCFEANKASILCPSPSHTLHGEQPPQNRQALGVAISPPGRGVVSCV